MKSLPDTWDPFYRRRGRMWGGITRDIPELPVGSRVLELGCGSGKTLRGMENRGWRVIALDISSEAIALSRAACSAEFVIGDGRSLPFREGSFDAVFAFHVLGHLLETQRCAMRKEIVRVLRNGGMLFFRGFSSSDFRASGEEIEERTFLRGDGTLTHYFTEDEVVGIFDSLELVSVETVLWNLRIRGRDLPRAEIRATFRKC